jgi:hypothetical protein
VVEPKIPLRNIMKIGPATPQLSQNLHASSSWKSVGPGKTWICG